jgi:IclR family transcriptional regulator, acetate operon repressor
MGVEALTDDAADRPNYPIQSVDRALRLILELERQPHITLTEAASLLAVSKSTAHRMLAMLVAHGFLRQDGETKVYIPGHALIRIGLAVVGGFDVRSLARPHLEALMRSTGETIHLVALSGTSVTFLDGIESPQIVRAASRIGDSLPAHCTGTGKAILSTWEDAAIDELYRDGLPPGLTPSSITTVAELKGELATIRERGWALNDGESETGLATVAVAVPMASDLVGLSLAFGAAGPASRMSAARREELAGVLAQRARLFGASMGRS